MVQQNTGFGCKILDTNFPVENRRAAFAGGPPVGMNLVLLFSDLLTVALTSQRLFHALFLARLQIEGMPLDLFNDVFGLYLAFEAAEGIFQWLSLLQSNFRQLNYTPKLFLTGQGCLQPLCVSVYALRRF